MAWTLLVLALVGLLVGEIAYFRYLNGDLLDRTASARSEQAVSADGGDVERSSLGGRATADDSTNGTVCDHCGAINDFEGQLTFCHTCTNRLN